MLNPSQESYPPTVPHTTPHPCVQPFTLQAPQVPKVFPLPVLLGQREDGGGELLQGHVEAREEGGPVLREEQGILEEHQEDAERLRIIAGHLDTRDLGNERRTSEKKPTTWSPPKGDVGFIPDSKTLIRNRHIYIYIVFV